MLVRGKQRYREGGTGSREGKQGGSILCLETDGRVNKDDWTVGFVEKKTAVLVVFLIISGALPAPPTQHSEPAAATVQAA